MKTRPAPLGAPLAEYRPHRVAAAAVLGGATSVIAGGKFANGAVTGAFNQLYNAEETLRQKQINKTRKVALDRLFDLRAEIVRIDDTTYGAIQLIQMEFSENMCSSHVVGGLTDYVTDYELDLSIQVHRTHDYPSYFFSGRSYLQGVTQKGVLETFVISNSESKLLDSTKYWNMSKQFDAPVTVFTTDNKVFLYDYSNKTMKPYLGGISDYCSKLK